MSPTRPARRWLPVLLILLLTSLTATACGAIANPQGWAAPVVREELGLVLLSDGAGKLGAYRLPGAVRLWEFPGNNADLDLDGLYGTPVLLDGTVYLSGYGGSLVAVNAADGAERWRQKVGARVIGGVLVAGESVYAGTDAGELVALDRATGNERWRRKIGNELWATPVTDGTAIYVAGMEGRITALTPDGEQLWQARVTDAAIAGTPALRYGVLYVGSYDKKLHAVDARSGERLWSSAAADNWFWTEPLVDGDTVLAGNLDGTVIAVDRRTGEQRWRSADLGAPVRGRLALAEGVLVVPTGDGTLWGLRPDSGQAAWGPVELGGRLYADLARTGDGLFVATEVGKKSIKLYRVTAATGAVEEIILTT